MNRGFATVTFLTLLASLTISGISFAGDAVSSTHFHARDDADSLLLSDLHEEKSYTTEYLRRAGEPATAELVKFSRACESGKSIVIGAVGDVLLHKALAVQGMNRANGFRSLWSELESEMKAPDFMYANLEGPTAGAVSAEGRSVEDPGATFDSVAYTSYPMFNYHPSLVGDLQASGIDIVSTANNHACDRRTLGIDRTIEELKKSGMPFTGTRTSLEAEKNTPAKSEWGTVTEKKGFRIGWIACTFSTNGISDPKKQVLMCFEQRDVLLSEIRRMRTDPSIDAVVVTPHWGVEYDHVPGADQKKLAKDMIEAGATIVFGNHPHVLQPVERVVASDGHEGYVIYSLGNFVSGQKGVAKRTSAMIFVGLTKNSAGEVFVNGARHLPLAMTYTVEGLMVRPARGNLEEGRLLANSILSQSLEIEPGEALVTNPECGSQ